MFLFHSWYVMPRFVRNMKMFCSEDLFWFQSCWSRDILHGNLTTFRKFHCHTDIVHKFDTSVSHMLKGLFNSCDIWLVSSYFVYIVTGATCGAGNAQSFRKTWFHSVLGVHDFTHSLYMHSGICKSKDYVYGLITSLFAWISLTALFWTYYIYI